MRNRQRHLAAFRFAAAGFDFHSNEFGGAFAVADDGLRQHCCDSSHRIAEREIFGTLRVDNLSHRGLAGRDQDETVVGRGISIDSDAIERALRGISDRGLDQRQTDHRVGGDEAEHGRHVRMDHAGAFGDAGHGDLCRADLKLAGHRLRHGIGRHDRLRRIGPDVGFKRGNTLRQAGSNALHRQRLHDDAG